MYTTEDPSAAVSRTAFNPLLFEERVSALAKSVLKQFRTITRAHTLFHLFFFLLGLLEVLALLSFFSFFTHTSVLAFTLAGFFLTVFSYSILLFYSQAKKPEQCQALKDSFVSQCSSLIPYSPGTSNYHLSIAHSLYTLVRVLHAQEYFYYPTPSRFASITSAMQKLSSWSHWKELHKMKELLIERAIQEHFSLIKELPTDVEAHASLAQAYMLLSTLYLDPRKVSPEEELPWVPKDYSGQEMQEKLGNAALRAIEEFKIVDSFAPNDPWVHGKLASLYRDLGRIEEEIETLQKLIKIAPKDPDVLVRLGTLYFQVGSHAKGLHIYEKLLREEDPRALDLIAHYGSLFSSSIGAQ